MLHKYFEKSNPNEMDTNILDINKQTQIIEMFKKHKIIDNNQRPRKRMKLLYRGSENNFESNCFYSECGGKENIFCVIKSEENNIFGGYSSKGWNVLNRNEEAIKYNSDSNAFLFCFKHNNDKIDDGKDEDDKNVKLETFRIRSKEESKYSTVSIPDTMCGFGEDGQDICISNNCNDNNDSWISFDEYGSSFNTPSHSYLNDGYGWFKVKEIEIFQIL